MFEIAVKEKDGVHWVDSKDLANELGIKSQYGRWLKRNITELKDSETGESLFSSNIDFMTVRSKTGGRPRTDIYLSIETAKEVSMMTKTLTGKKIRQFFVEIQNAYNNGALIEAGTKTDQLLIENQDRINYLEKAVDQRDVYISTMISSAQEIMPKDPIGTESKKTGRPRINLRRACYVSAKQDDPKQLVFGFQLNKKEGE